MVGHAREWGGGGGGGGIPQNIFESHAYVAISKKSYVLMRNYHHNTVCYNSEVTSSYKFFPPGKQICQQCLSPLPTSLAILVCTTRLESRLEPACCYDQFITQD